MALQNQHSLSGLIGPVVVYNLNGQQVVRKRPRKHKKSAKSQQAAKDFGETSQMTRQFLNSILAETPGWNSLSTRHRLMRTIREWMKNGRQSLGTESSGPSPIDQLQFNEQAALTSKLRVPLTIDWSQPKKIVVHIPAIIPSRDIMAPARTESIRWVFEAAGTAISSRQNMEAFPIAEMVTKYSDDGIDPQSVTIPFPVSTGELILVVLFLQYRVKGEQVTDSKWTPAGVIGSYYQE